MKKKTKLELSRAIIKCLDEYFDDIGFSYDKLEIVPSYRSIVICWAPNKLVYKESHSRDIPVFKELMKDKIIKEIWGG